MKVLYISNKPLYPKVDGGTVAMANFLELLLNIENIKLFHLAISTEKHPFSISDYPEKIKNRCSIDSVQISTGIKWNHALKHLLAGSSYNLARFNTSLVKQRIEKLLNEQEFDYLIGESIYSLAWLNELNVHSKTKVICRTHNVEHLIWENLAKNASPAKKMVLIKACRDSKKGRNSTPE